MLYIILRSSTTSTYIETSFICIFLSTDLVILNIHLCIYSLSAVFSFNTDLTRMLQKAVYQIMPVISAVVVTLLYSSTIFWFPTTIWLFSPPLPEQKSKNLHWAVAFLAFLFFFFSFCIIFWTFFYYLTDCSSFLFLIF